MSINSGVVDRGLFQITKDTFVTPVTQEIPRDLEALVPRTWDKDQIHASYITVSQGLCGILGLDGLEFYPHGEII